MMDGAFEFLLHGARVFGCDARGEDVLAVIEKFGGNSDHLLGGFAGAEYHFGKAGAQRAMSIDLREPNVGDRRGLKGLQDFLAPDAAGAKFFQKLSRFGDCHALTMPQK